MHRLLCLVYRPKSGAILGDLLFTVTLTPSQFKEKNVMKLLVIVAGLVTVMLFPALSSAGDVVLIGNLSIRESTLSQKDINYIFLGKKSNWDDGTKIKIAVQTDKNLHKLFLKKYIGKSPTQFATYWKKMVFTGKGSSPLAHDNNRKMINFVSETKGAIGYVSTDSNLDNVKTISVK
jgi:ABC-type phosphate transport system substrate-binding protein